MYLDIIFYEDKMPLLHKEGLDPSGNCPSTPRFRRAIIANKAMSVDWVSEIECTGRSESGTSWKACT